MGHGYLANGPGRGRCPTKRCRAAASQWGIWAAARDGAPLLLRTVALRIAIIATVAVATRLGEVALAGHQIVNSLWGFTAFALDALAIAAQTLIAQAIGAAGASSAGEASPAGASGTPPDVRAVLRRCVVWGLACGGILGVLLAGSGWWLAPLFTPASEVRVATAIALAFVGLLLPISAYAFMLDGVLMGADDGRFLAVIGFVNLAIYLPFLWVVYRWAPHGASGLAWLWAAFAGIFMAARALTTGLRTRGTAWLHLQAEVNA